MCPCMLGSLTAPFQASPIDMIACTLFSLMKFLMHSIVPCVASGPLLLFFSSSPKSKFWSLMLVGEPRCVEEGLNFSYVRWKSSVKSNFVLLQSMSQRQDPTCPSLQLHTCPHLPHNQLLPSRLTLVLTPEPQIPCAITEREASTTITTVRD